MTVASQLLLHCSNSFRTLIEVFYCTFYSQSLLITNQASQHCWMVDTILLAPASDRRTVLHRTSEVEVLQFETFDSGRKYCAICSLIVVYCFIGASTLPVIYLHSDCFLYELSFHPYERFIAIVSFN